LEASTVSSLVESPFESLLRWVKDAPVIVLDTNVLFEVMKPSPSGAVIRWMAGHSRFDLSITVMTMAEIFYGVELPPSGRRRTVLSAAIHVLLREEFKGRILPFDADAAGAYPAIVATRRRLGRPISQFDAQIAAIAVSRNAALATRNTSDFDRCGVTVVDPWTA
jgi:toxin FitB